MLKIGLAQMRAEEDWEANLGRAMTLMEEGKGQGVQMICFPEVGLRRFFPQYRADRKYFEWAEPIPGPTTDKLSRKARELEMVVVVSVYEAGRPGAYYDSAAVIDADGSLLGVTRMMHIAEEPNYNEKFYYWPGDTGYPVYETAYADIGVAICYDCRFPEHMRALALGGAEVIFVPTAESGDRILETWTIENQASSLANNVFVAVANRVGKEDQMTFVGRSYVTNPFGKVLSMAGGEEEELLAVDVDLTEVREARQIIPYMRDRRPETYDVLMQH